ncbi:hypothetical protein BJY52DRAFT_1224244 [Lactarius psammicola]|nr:hypothetical protein BJY52DRAFT_1224244 [Lactarius psammicola]
MFQRSELSQGHPVRWPITMMEQAATSEAHPEVGVTGSPTVLIGSEVSMDETSDSPPRTTIEYERFPDARTSGGSTPRPLSMGERKRKLTGSGVQDDRLAKRPNTETDPSVQCGPSHEATSRLSKVEEELRSALQEIEGLRAQIGMLQARDEQTKKHLCSLRLMAHTSMRITNVLLADGVGGEEVQN